MTEKRSNPDFETGASSDSNHRTTEGTQTGLTGVSRRSILSAAATALTLPVIGRTVPGAVDGTAYEPIGQLRFDNAREVVVDDAGEIAYIAADTRVIAVDVSDPADPTVLSELQLGTDHLDRPLLGIYDAKIDGDRLIAGGPNGYAERYAGFGVVDISDPSAMREVAFKETSPDHGIHNCYLDGDYAYLTGTNSTNGGQSKLRIYEIADDDPEEIATWYPGDHDSGWNDVIPILRNLHDVYVQDGTAYLSYWDAGVFLLNVSDPSSPEYISRFGDHTLSDLQEIDQGNVSDEYVTPPGNAHYTTVNNDGTVLGEGGESWTDSESREGGPSGITLYDISDPTAPEPLATIEPEETGNNTFEGYWSTSHNFEIHGDKLYSSWYHAGVKIHDISDPANPEQIAWYAQPDSLAFWTAQVGVPDEFFVATAWGGSNERDDVGLFTFPDEAGEMAEPPEFPPLQDDDSDEMTSQVSPDQTTVEPATEDPSTAEPTTVASQTPDGTTLEPEDGTTSNDDSNSDGSPGLGILSALAGLGIGAWRFTRKKDQ